MLAEYLDTIERRRKECTVYSSDPETDLDEHLATRNVSVTHKRLPPGGPEPFVTIRANSDVVGALPVRQVKALLSPPADRSLETGLSETFELFDETLFTSLERRQLLLASREIEDRAARVASGTLRVRFQTPGSFEPQKRLYRRLAAETDLSIHLYGTADWTPPDIDGITFHSAQDGELEPYWCLAFDGGPEPEQACVLLAEEHDCGYEGFWSYDSDLVSTIMGSLSTVG